MANEASYVPLGRDNTGAAVQLNPFDSSKIFAAYDKANAPVKTPLLDSYGTPLKTGSGAVDPIDRWWIEESTNKFIDYSTKLRQKTQAERRDANSEEQQELQRLRQEVLDRTSVAQKQLNIANEWDKKITANPYLYGGEEARKKLLKWKRETPINERINSLGPDIETLPDKTAYDLLKGIGTSKVGVDVQRTRADGSSYSEKVDKFSPREAEKNFNKSVVPMLMNPYSKEGQMLVAIQTNKLKEKFEEDGRNWDDLSPQDQSELVIEATKADYFAAQEVQVAESNATATKAAQDKTTTKGGGKSSTTPRTFDINAGHAYRKVSSKNNKVIPIGSQQEGDVEIVNTVTIPIKNDQFEELNKELKFKNGSVYVKGTVENIHKYADVDGNWDDEVWVTVVDKDGTPTEVLLDAENLKTFKENIKFDPIKVLKEKEPKWKNHRVDIVKPEDMPGWNAKSEEERVLMNQAYDKKIKQNNGKTKDKVTVPSKWKPRGK